MQKEELIELARELKADEEDKAITLFEEFAKDNNINEEELEQILSKEYDCFRCESCHKFYCYDEYSFFDEVCIYCNDAHGDEEEY
ncbi:hypothetical protein KKG81_03120 [bacterium]|jgi:energy-converting hydrogenase A subunit M|nr:hypothetical protein [bacterium]